MGADNYEDMLPMQHPTSKRHPAMSMYDRAAQFSPFAALTGHEDAIKETGRLTDEKMVLTEQKKEELDRVLQILMEHISKRPSVRITFFKADEKKSGGKYLTITEKLVKINDRERCFVFDTGLQIELDDIYEISIPYDQDDDFFCNEE